MSRDSSEELPAEVLSASDPDNEEMESRWSFVRRFNRYISVVEDVCAGLGAASLVIMVLVVSYGVIGRKVLGRPTAWTLEISEYSLLYLTFLTVPWVLRENGHVRLEILVAAVNARWRTGFLMVGYVLSFVVVSVLFYFSLDTTLSYYDRGVVLRKVFDIPQWMIVWVIPVGSFLLTLRVACQFLTRISRKPVA